MTCMLPSAMHKGGYSSVARHFLGGSLPGTFTNGWLFLCFFMTNSATAHILSTIYVCQYINGSGKAKVKYMQLDRVPSALDEEVVWAFVS